MDVELPNVFKSISMFNIILIEQYSYKSIKDINDNYVNFITLMLINGFSFSFFSFPLIHGS